MSNQKKKTIYRHPVTNKFISKREWEELQKTEVEDNIEPSGSDFDLDPVYIQNTQKFIDEIEKDFNKIVETISSKEEEKPPSGWKLFLHKLKFWV
jgi:hypothetical protein